MKHLIRSFILGGACALSCSFSSAQNAKLVDEGVKQIEVVTLHFYRSWTYAPAKKVTPEQAVDGVEKVIAHHFQSMRNGNISDFLATWDNASANEIRKLQARETEQAIKSRWASVLAGRDVELVARYQYRDYDLVEYRLVDTSTQTVKLTDVLVLSKEEKNRLTLALKADPVLRGIREHKKRVEDVVEMPRR